MAVVQWTRQDQIARVEMCNGANTMNLKFAHADPHPLYYL